MLYPVVLYSLLIIYAIGAIFNGCILITIIANRPLRKSRVDQITAALILAVFLWSLGRVFIQTMLILGLISINDPVAAAFSNLVIVCLFGLNLNLALERFSILQPTTDGFRPLLQPQRQIWLIVVPAISYAGNVVLMIVFYTATYQYSKKKLADRSGLASFFVTNMENDIDDEMVESLHQKSQLQILFKCIGLSMSLVVFYVPLLVYGVAVMLNESTSNNSTLIDTMALIMSLDAILIPAM
ncbi:hypothetical protein HK100_003330, partial [Physocladia obscura]